MRRVLSMSVSMVMMGIMMMTGADVQQDQEEIQSIFEYVQETPAQAIEVETPEGEMISRTHTVHVFTQEDADLMKRVALAEGETEGADGLWLILSVIANRVSDPAYPNTVSGVVYQKNAFSSIHDGNFAKAPATTEECEEAFARIEAGDICPEIIAFEGINSDVLDKWFMEAFTYRHHKFYTKK